MEPFDLPLVSRPTLADILNELTVEVVEGDLCERLEDNRIRCYACGHRCRIPEGRQGICKVRFNEGGKLRVPWGYVGGLQCDPTEKKPFFHVYPGSNTLTFGMLGCDLHCSYCFPAETPIITDRGVIPIQQAFEMGSRRICLQDGDVSAPPGLQAVASDGELRPVRQVFRHRYTGPLTVIRPYYFPPLRCTPNHKVYVCTDPDSGKIEPIEASKVSPEHYLVIPKRLDTSAFEKKDIDVHSVISENPHCRETAAYYLVPIRSIASADFSGYVYNMEVDQKHNYLAGFFLVKNCQNWLTSQALRDPAADVRPREISAEQLIATGRQLGAMMVASSYNEPLITSEWALEVFRAGRAEGLKTAFVSNGNATPEVLDYLRPWTDCYKIDLKTMSDRNYRKLGGVLQNVLDTVQMVYDRGFWMEIVTLLVPDWNTSDAELRDAARFLAAISPDIPWHVTAFHKDYKMTEPDNASSRILLRAAEIGKSAGLRYVYAGNLPGQVGAFENTCCHACGALLVERFGFHVRQVRIGEEGACPDCGQKIPGIWGPVHQKGDGYVRPLRV